MNKMGDMINDADVKDVKVIFQERIKLQHKLDVLHGKLIKIKEKYTQDQWGNIVNVQIHK